MDLFFRFHCRDWVVVLADKKPSSGYFLQDRNGAVAHGKYMMGKIEIAMKFDTATKTTIVDRFDQLRNCVVAQSHELTRRRLPFSRLSEKPITRIGENIA